MRKGRRLLLRHTPRCATQSASVHEYAGSSRLQPRDDALNSTLVRRPSKGTPERAPVFHLGASAERFWGLHRAAVRAEESLAKKGFYFLPKLDYPLSEGVWPLFSADSLRTHLHQHHSAAVDALNERVLGTMWEAQPLDVILRKCAMDVTQIDIHHAAVQHFHHCLFWRSIVPGGSNIPQDLRGALKERFGSIDEFTALFTRHCERIAEHCGSGWVFLVWKDDKFEVLPLPSPGSTPLAMDYVPLLVIDMFEHSYMHDYGSDVKKYVLNFFRAVNWTVVHKWWQACPK